MSKLFVIKQNETYTFTFNCEYGKTRNGFFHKATMYVNGGEYFTSKANYLNRTWERFTYQTVMLNAVRTAIVESESVIIDSYKRSSHLERVSKKIKDELIGKDEYIKTLNELIKIISESDGYFN